MYAQKSQDGTAKASAKDLVTSYDADGVVVQDTEWGGQNVGFQRYPKGFDLRPLLKGLPHDECQCPHWGYVTKGRLVIEHAGRSTVVGPGEAYYMAPGHNIRFDADTELVEISPAAELAKTLAQIEKNLTPGASR